MQSINLHQAEAFSQELFQCASCHEEFPAKVITWVDASRAPQVKQALLRWEFNVIQCRSCGSRQFAETPFFYEDFEEGLLVAVFPQIPEKRAEIEESIRKKYGYYPVLEYFYDMAQIWTLLYLQEHYRVNRNLRSLSRIGGGERRLRKVLRFLKEDPMMIAIREKLNASSSGDAGEDELMDLLSRAVYSLEEMRPWPRDRRCSCGGDLMKEFKCCGAQIKLEDHDRLLSRHYVVYCPNCSEPLAGASCEICGKVYTWKLGTLATWRMEEKKAPPAAPVRRRKNRPGATQRRSTP